MTHSSILHTGVCVLLPPPSAGFFRIACAHSRFLRLSEGLCSRCPHPSATSFSFIPLCLSSSTFYLSPSSPHISHTYPARCRSGRVKPFLMTLGGGGGGTDALPLQPQEVNLDSSSLGEVVRTEKLKTSAYL